MARTKLVCLSATFAVTTITLVFIFFIHGPPVFQAKNPVITVDSINLAKFHFSFNMPKLRAYVNITLNTVITVKNPNLVGINYSNSTAFLNYRGTEVGQAPIPAGKIEGRDVSTLNLTLTVMADRLLSNSNFYADVISGTLPFQTDIRLSGKVRIIFNIDVVASANCQLKINLNNRTLANQICHYVTGL